MKSLEKFLTEKEIEDNQSLYLKSEDDKKLVINLNQLSVEDRQTIASGVGFSYDPHGGFYFYGDDKVMKIMKKAIENETEFATK